MGRIWRAKKGSQKSLNLISKKGSNHGRFKEGEIGLSNEHVFNEVKLFAFDGMVSRSQMEKNILVSEISQSEQDKYHMNSLICGI